MTLAPLALLADDETIADLCSGYGGLAIGLRLALGGGRVVCHADNSEGASAILAARFPEVPNLGDIKEVDWSQFGPVDWLCAGYPCQPFSDAGKRLGEADPRHLWPWVARAIEAVKPRRVLLENVRGHVKRGLPTVLAELEALGYGGAWGVFTAESVGAPHRRARVFVVAERDRPGGFHEVKPPKSASVGPLLKTPTSQLAINGGSQHPDKRKAGGHGPTLAVEVEHLLPTPAARLGRGGGMPSRELAERRRQERAPGPNLDEVVALLPTPRGSDTGTEGRRASEGFRPPLSQVIFLLPTPTTRNASGNRANNRGELLLPGVAHLLPTPRGTDGTHGGPGQRGRRGDLMMPSVVFAQDWEKYAPAIERWEALFGFPAPPATVPGTRSGRVLNPKLPEWMMGLPPGFISDLPITRNAQLMAIGNGVNPFQAAYAVLTLLAFLNGEESPDMNPEEVKAANRERNTEIVQAAREGYADGNECTSIAAALFKVAEQFRARSADITARKVKGHVGTTKALTFAAEEVENVAASLTAEGSNWARAASEVAGVAVSLERDGTDWTTARIDVGDAAARTLDAQLDRAFGEPPLPARDESEQCAAGFALPNGAVAVCYYRAGHEGMHSDGNGQWQTAEEAAADALIEAGAHAERCTARLDDSGPDGGEGVRCTLPAGHEGGHADSDEGLRPEWYSEPPLTDAELPGMWESADFTGGETDAKRWPTDAEITENHRQLTQQDNPDVCGSTSAGEPCALPTGHTGTHIGTRGGRWPQAHALTPHVEGEPVPDGAVKVTVGGTGIPGVDGAAFIAEGEAARMISGPIGAGDFSIGHAGNRYTAQESGWYMASAPVPLQRVGSTAVLELNDVRPVELSLGVDSMFPGTEPHVVEQRVPAVQVGALATLPLAAPTLVIGGPARTAPVPLEAPGEPKGYQSASSIETMLDCPMKYRLKYRDRLTESPSWWFEGGKAFHAWVEQTERRLAFAQPHVVEMACDVIAGEAPRDLAEIFEQQITKAADEKGVAPEKWRAAKKGAEGREFWEGLLPDMAARYLLERQATAKDYGIAITPYGLPMIEHEIRFDVAGVPIVGYIDQVRRNLHTGALVIRDLKAGARKPETDFQVGGLYRQALLGLYPYLNPQDVRGEYFMTRKAEIVPAANWTRKAVEHQVASVDAMDKAGIFPAHPSSFCGSCPFRRQCPVMGGEE